MSKKRGPGFLFLTVVLPSKCFQRNKMPQIIFLVCLNSFFSICKTDHLNSNELKEVLLLVCFRRKFDPISYLI